ncbi:LysR family transcriptional regulator [Aeromicrobium sp.]|uniref:LysR family transcriptional regulator n=1 Tax=Aeromicrobium sp. TaxID=1871063 RepID=UPI0019A8C4A7|nr:LysR family transcriptional regulator [Aeromicrobium sp.]MBC7633841.1 LysR family transcriptional regulator [Aeromicrobium sp.]
MDIETRHLRIVKAVADEGSITRAATVLGTTQPALTRQVRRVEDHLGGPLFQRSRSGVELTPLGRVVIGRANAVLSVIDSLQTNLVVKTAFVTPPEVRIGVTLGNALVGLLRGLRSVVPGTEIITENETRIDGLLDLLSSRRLDFAVIHEFVGHEIPLDPRLLTRPVGCEPAFVLMAADHPLAGLGELDLADLHEEEWLLSPLDVDREADCMTRICFEAGFTPRISNYLSDGLSIELIRAGEAIALSTPTVRDSGMVLKPLIGIPMRTRRLLVIDRDNPFVGHLDKLARFTAEVLTETLEHQPVYRAWHDAHGTLPAGPRGAA